MTSKGEGTAVWDAIFQDACAAFEYLLSACSGNLDAYAARERSWMAELNHRLRSRGFGVLAECAGFCGEGEKGKWDHDLVIDTSRPEFSIDARENLIAIEAKRWFGGGRPVFEWDWAKLASSRCQERMWLLAMRGYSPGYHGASDEDGFATVEKEMLASYEGDGFFYSGDWCQHPQAVRRCHQFDAKWDGKPYAVHVLAWRGIRPTG